MEVYNLNLDIKLTVLMFGFMVEFMSLHISTKNNNFAWLVSLFYIVWGLILLCIIRGYLDLSQIPHWLLGPTVCVQLLYWDDGVSLTLPVFPAAIWYYILFTRFCSRIKLFGLELKYQVAWGTILPFYKPFLYLGLSLNEPLPSYEMNWATLTPERIFLSPGTGCGLYSVSNIMGFPRA